MARRNGGASTGFAIGLGGVAAVVGVVGVCCFGGTALAQNTAQLGLNPSFAGGQGPVNLIETRPGAIELSASTTGGAGTVISGWCFVDDGIVLASGASSGSGNSVSRGIFRDRIVVTAPGVPTGTPGTLTFKIVVDGELDASAGSTRAAWALWGDIGGGATDLRAGADYYAPSFPDPRYRGNPFGEFTATGSFGFGFPADLYVQFEAAAVVAYNADGPGAGAYGSPARARWGGISDVRVNGVPVGSFTITSVTGTDWVVPFNVCPADVNGDGFLDFFDYDDFVSAFESGVGDADFNNDGFVDFFDYDDFVEAFEAGC